MYITLLAISIGVTLIVSFSSYLVYLREKSQTQRELLVEGERNLERLIQFVDAEYRTVSEDLAFLSRNPAFASYLDSEPLIARKAIENTLATYGEIRGNYTKIRLIDTAGVERLKVEYAKEGIKINEGLQFKGDRYYFKGSKKLRPGEIYISYFDLNKEFGEYAKPYQPVLRFSTPFSNDSGQIKGNVVLTFDGNNILKYSNQLERSEQLEMYILTASTGYIRGQFP